MPAWVGLGALGEAGAGFLEGRNAAEQEAYKRKLDREGIAEKQEELGISKGYLENARRRDAIEAAREKRLSAAGMLPQEIPPRPGWPTMTTDGKPLAYFSGPGGIFAKVADLPAGIKTAPATMPAKGKWAEDVAEFESVFGRKPTPAEAMRLKEGRPKGSAASEDKSVLGKTIEWGNAVKTVKDKMASGQIDKSTGMAMLNHLKMDPDKKSDKISPKVSSDVANWRASENFLDMIEKVVEKYKKYEIPGVGNAITYFGTLGGKGVSPKELAKARRDFQLETAAIIRQTGAGARGYGPMERGWFDALRTSFGNTYSQNMGSIGAWRDYIRANREAAARVYQGLNTEKYKKAFGRDADVLAIDDAESSDGTIEDF